MQKRKVKCRRFVINYMPCRSGKEHWRHGKRWPRRSLANVSVSAGRGRLDRAQEDGSADSAVSPALSDFSQSMTRRTDQACAQLSQSVTESFTEKLRVVIAEVQASDARRFEQANAAEKVSIAGTNSCRVSAEHFVATRRIDEPPCEPARKHRIDCFVLTRFNRLASSSFGHERFPSRP